MGERPEFKQGASMTEEIAQQRILVQNVFLKSDNKDSSGPEIELKIKTPDEYFKYNEKSLILFNTSA